LEGKRDFSLLANDLEEAAFEEAPALKARAGRIRKLLVREGARLAALSGSGSSYFGFFDGPDEARRAVRALREDGVEAWRARTLAVDGYRRACSAGVASLG
jgi:4-diphosphocytidyl-2-C-methyl-D-erythritol kinase